MVYRLTTSRIMDKFDWFVGKFQYDLFPEEQIEIFNKFADEHHMKEEIFPMEDFDKKFATFKPSDILFMICQNKNDINWRDKYVGTTSEGFKTFDEPYDFIEDYIGNIFDNMHIWETKINIDDYIKDMYDGHFDLKPEDMDSDKFYDIVEDAVYSNDYESDIVADIEKAVNKN